MIIAQAIVGLSKRLKQILQIEHSINHKPAEPQPAGDKPVGYSVKV